MLKTVSDPSSREAGVQDVQDAPSWHEFLGITVLFVALSALYLRLSPERFLNAIAPDFGDPLFNLSVLRWGASRLSSAFSDFWNPTFFFPTQGVLALSDHLTGPAVMYRLLDAVGLPPAGAYNTLLVIAFGGSGAACYWVLRRSQLSVLGALGGGITWTFCGFRWSALSHLQVLLALTVPVTLWLFHRLLLQPSWPAAARFLAAYALHLSAGAYLAMMIHVPFLAILWVHVAELNSKSVRELRKAPLAAAATASAAMLWAVFAPYLRSRRGLVLETPIFDLSPYMVTLKSYLSVGPRTLYSEWFPIQLKGHAQLWPGFMAAALCAAGFALYLRRRLKPGSGAPRRELWFFCSLIACCLFVLLVADIRVWAGGLSSQSELRSSIKPFLASVGVVVLVWIYWCRRKEQWLERAGSAADLWWKCVLALSLLSVLASHVAAFVLLRDALPGFDAIRVPGRFFVFSSLGLAALIGLGIHSIDRVLPRRNIAVPIQGIALVLLALEFIPNAKYIQWDELPSEAHLAPEYQWLSEQPGAEAVVELPFLENWREAERMYFWSIHHHPIVNGYSAYLPQPYRLLKEKIGLFPDQEVLSELEQIGVSFLIIHLEKYSTVERRDWRRWQKNLIQRTDPPIALIHEAGWAMVYRIGPGLGN